jgi:hypothetical protein
MGDFSRFIYLLLEICYIIGTLRMRDFHVQKVQAARLALDITEIMHNFGKH